MGSTAYGVYLIPPPALAYQVGLAHLLLKSVFGLEAAGKFMPHCTLFAFIHLQEGLGEKELMTVLDQILPTQIAFPLEYGLETGRFVRLDLAQHPTLMQLQNRLHQELSPLLSEYGLSKRKEAPFYPHISIAYSDLPNETGLLAQIHAFCQQLYWTMPKTGQVANLVQLIEFKVPTYNEWDTPDYWRRMTWRIIKGYNLVDSLHLS